MTIMKRLLRTRTIPRELHLVTTPSYHQVDRRKDFSGFALVNVTIYSERFSIKIDRQPPLGGGYNYRGIYECPENTLTFEVVPEMHYLRTFLDTSLAPKWQTEVAAGNTFRYYYWDESNSRWRNLDEHRRELWADPITKMEFRHGLPESFTDT